MRNYFESVVVILKYDHKPYGGGTFASHNGDRVLVFFTYEVSDSLVARRMVFLFFFSYFYLFFFFGWPCNALAAHSVQ